MVQTPLTKTDTFAFRCGRHHITNLHFSLGDHDTVDEQLHHCRFCSNVAWAKPSVVRRQKSSRVKAKLATSAWRFTGASNCACCLSKACRRCSPSLRLRRY